MYYGRHIPIVAELQLPDGIRRESLQPDIDEIVLQLFGFLQVGLAEMHKRGSFEIHAATFPTENERLKRVKIGSFMIGQVVAGLPDGKGHVQIHLVKFRSPGSWEEVK